VKKLFISYSHKDEDLKKQFVTHLSGLKQAGLIEIWDDRQVIIGEKWDSKINEKLADSEIVVFLISADFLQSEYINNIEIKKTIERHKNGEVYIAPIFLRPCYFESSILSSFQGVPRDLKFITSWGNIDEAFLNVINELRKIISEFTKPLMRENIKIPNSKIQTIPCDTPPDIAKWVGRKNELEILNSKHFKAIFITGFGGQGKSSLAARYVYEQMQYNSFEYWDWRDFKEEGNRLKTKITEIIKRFSDSDCTQMDLKEATNEDITKLFFESLGNRKIIFVFDNIDSYIDYADFIPIDGFQQFVDSCINIPHNCKFIFTCRPFIRRADVGFYQIELKGLTYEETARLLDKYSIPITLQNKEPLYTELHKITKGHPLWLNLLGAQAVSGIDKIEKFIASVSFSISSDAEDISAILSEKIIDAIWITLNLKQQKLLRCLSEIVKAENMDHLEKMVSNELSYNHFSKALRHLKLLNLVVTKTTQSGKEEIELHPLVKSYIRNKYPLVDRSKYISIIIEYYNRLTYALKQRISGNETLDFYENWTSKVELAINKKDFHLALSALQEVSDSILTAGYPEEYIRIAKLLFDQINFIEHYNNKTPYFIEQIDTFINLLSEMSNFSFAREMIDKYKNIVQNKGKDYVRYCELECNYFWHKLDNNEAIKWGERGLSLISSSKTEDVFGLLHLVNRAKRDTFEENSIKEALTYFSKGADINTLITSPINENLSAQFYGNLGRCYFLLNRFDIAKALYSRSFTLTHKEEVAYRFMNRGYISYWLGQVLQKEGNNRMAFLFFSNCMIYWKKHAPHRSSRVEEEINILKRDIPHLEELLKLDATDIERECKSFNDKYLQGTIANAT
jgi:tetratricopeptide (TPR) repeat protein